MPVILKIFRAPKETSNKRTIVHANNPCEIVKLIIEVKVRKNEKITEKPTTSLLDG